jgi:hypothetical protein
MTDVILATISSSALRPFLETTITGLYFTEDKSEYGYEIKTISPCFIDFGMFYFVKRQIVSQTSFSELSQSSDKTNIDAL